MSLRHFDFFGTIRKVQYEVQRIGAQPTTYFFWRAIARAPGAPPPASEIDIRILRDGRYKERFGIATWFKYPSQTSYQFSAKLSLFGLGGTAADKTRFFHACKPWMLLSWPRLGFMDVSEAWGIYWPDFTPSDPATFIRQREIRVHISAWFAEDEVPCPYLKFRPYEMSNSLSRGLLGLFDRGNCFGDFTVKCRGASFPCHSFVLAARSLFFRAMLSPTAVFREAREGAVVLDDLTPAAVKSVLSYLYGRSLALLLEANNGDILIKETASDVFRAFDRLLVEEAIDCWSYMFVDGIEYGERHYKNRFLLLNKWEVEFALLLLGSHHRLRPEERARLIFAAAQSAPLVLTTASWAEADPEVKLDVLKALAGRQAALLEEPTALVPYYPPEPEDDAP